MQATSVESPGRAKRKHVQSMHVDLSDSNFTAPDASEKAGNPRALTPTNTPFIIPSCLAIEAESPGGTSQGVLLTPNSAKFRGGSRSSRESEIRDKHLVMSIDLRAEGADESDSWLTGVFIDYIFQRFAHRYEDTVFLPTAFAAVQLPQLYRGIRRGSTNGPRSEQVSKVDQFRSFEMVDVLGRKISPGIWNRRRQSSAGYRQILLLHNAGANHWTLIRIIPPKFVKKVSASKKHAAAKKAAAEKLSQPEPPAHGRLKAESDEAPPAKRAGSPKATAPLKHFPAPAELAPAGKTWDFTTGRWVSLRHVQKLVAEESLAQERTIELEAEQQQEVGPQMNLFEPMGKPSGRGGSRGVSRRSLPEGVLEWLDAVSPLSKLNAPAATSPTDSEPSPTTAPSDISVQWKSCSSSVLTTAKQQNSFDCGVACLLYAECCAMGLTTSAMQNEIGQTEITHYRSLLEKYIKAIAGVGLNPTDTFNHQT